MGAMGTLAPTLFRFLPCKLTRLSLCGPHSHEYFRTPLISGFKIGDFLIKSPIAKVYSSLIFLLYGNLEF